MNYKDIVNQLSKNRKIMIFLVMIILVAALYIDSINRKNNITELAPIGISDQIKSNTSNELNKSVTKDKIFASNKLNLSTIPSSVDVFSYVQSDFTENDAYKLMDQLKFVIQNKDQKILKATNKEKILIYRIDQKKLEYSDQSYKLSKNMDKDKSFYQKSLETYIKSIGLKMDGYNFSSMSYLSGSSTELELTDNLGTAVLVELIYRHEKNGNMIIADSTKGYGSYIDAYVDNNGNVIKFTYDLIGTVTDKVGNVDIKPKEKIESEIKKGEVKFLSATFNEQNYVKAVAVENAKIAYYVDNGKLIPIIYMSGTVSTDKYDARGYLVMDAIENE